MSERHIAAEKSMRRRRTRLLGLLGLMVVVAEIYLRVSYPSIAKSIVFMLGLEASARLVGAIPRQERTRQAQFACSIIGWPMFVTFLVLMAVSVYGMFIFGAPEYIVLIGFLWVLAQLTWKIFIHPTTTGSDSK